MNNEMVKDRGSLILPDKTKLFKEREKERRRRIETKKEVERRISG